MLFLKTYDNIQVDKGDEKIMFKLSEQLYDEIETILENNEMEVISPNDLESAYSCNDGCTSHCADGCAHCTNAGHSGQEYR